MFRAVHVQQQRSVALKILSAPFGTGKEARLAFSLEWEQLKGLRHPHIVRCFGGGMEDKQGYLAYELIRGESLAALLKRRGRLAWESVVDDALQIASALEYAHQQGFVHAALAPDKILVAADGPLKILDFRENRFQNAAFQSSSGLSPQSALYAAPEQFGPSPQITPKCDLYALGCILFEMLTGEPPFRASSVEQLGQLHREQPPEHISRIVLECPIWLDGLVAQLLQKDPQQRPHSMGAVRIALEETRQKMAEGVGVAEHVTSGISALKTSADRREAARLLGKQPKKRKRRVADQAPFYERAWFLALCLVLLLLGGVWMMWPPSEEKLFRRAEALMASGDEGAARRARTEYLEPLLARFPAGQHAAQAQQWIDEMDMDLAERRLRRKLKLGQDLETEGERLLAEAWRFEQFGDKLTSLEKYESMVDLLPSEPANRPYRNIARREAAALQGEGNLAEQRRAFLDSRLADAARLAEEGKQDEAERIWRSILNLYGNRPELSEFADRARRALGESLLQGRPNAVRTDEPGGEDGASLSRSEPADRILPAEPPNSETYNTP